MTETLPKGMSNLNETVYDDGSGYKASLKFFGRTWYLDYTAGRQSVRGTFSQYESQRGRKNDNARKVLAKFLSDRIESFGEDWNNKHNELYKEVIAAHNHLDSLDKWPEFMYHLPTIEQCVEYAATVAPEGLAKDWGLTFFYKTR